MIELSKNELDELYNEQSKYCYKGTDVLINKKNIMNADVLLKVERIQVTYVLSNLYIKPIVGNFDVNHYLKIHEILFQNLYSFAGKFRDENISKKGIPFCRPEFIYDNLKVLLEQMNKKSYAIKSEEELIDYLAYYYSEINIVHPFREGNGRTQREFFRELVLELNNRINFGNYEIDFSQLSETDKKVLILGSIEGATKGTTEYLKQFFRACLIKTEQKQL